MFIQCANKTSEYFKRIIEHVSDISTKLYFTIEETRFVLFSIDHLNVYSMELSIPRAHFSSYNVDHNCTYVVPINDLKKLLHKQNIMTSILGEVFLPT